MSLLRANAPEAVRWCPLGCGKEMTLDALVEGKCKCGGTVVDLGWRYRDSKGALCYASTFDTLPPEVRRAA